ncbi:hypothetical protein ABZ942_36765 [Nocardia sp. NPDC046473]
MSDDPFGGRQPTSAETALAIARVKAAERGIEADFVGATGFS